MQLKYWGPMALLGGLAVAGCGGNSANTGGIFNQPAPRLRAVNAMDGVTSGEVTVAGQIVSSAISYGGVSGTNANPYAILNQRGNETINFYSASNPAVVLATTSHDFTYGDVIDTIFFGGASSPKAIQLYDNTQNAANGASIRWVDAANSSGTLDVFLTPAGSGMGSPATFSPGEITPIQASASSTYSELVETTATSYTIAVYPAGHDSGVPLGQVTMTINPGDRWTFVLIDPATSGAQLQILAVQDNNANG